MTLEQLNLKKIEFDPRFHQEEWFYKDKQGTIIPYLKEDIQRAINPLIPATFFPLLELFDIPYIEEEWLRTVRYAYEHNCISTVFGKYLALMKLAAYRLFTFRDTQVQFAKYQNYDNIKYDIHFLITHII